MFKTAIFLTVIFTTIIKVSSSLQCYVCYDCLSVKDEYLTSCDSLTPPTANSTDTSEPSTSTSSTTPSSTSSNTTTPTNTSTESSSSTITTTSTSTEINSSNTTSSTNQSDSTTATMPATTESASSNSTTTTTKLLPPPPHTEKSGKADESFQCFQGKIHVNNTDVIVRGCAKGRTNETCESFGLTSCSFCNTDKCNSAGTIQSSVLLAVTVLLYMVCRD